MNRIYVQDIVNILNKYMNEKYAFDYDNVGLILGNKNQFVSKIICCLDVTKDIIQEAIISNSNLIISHHPIIFNPLKKIIYNDNYNNMNIIIDAIKNDISIICMHTNIDCVSNGTSNLLCKKLKLQNITNIKNNNTIIYKIGELRNKLNFQCFLNYIKENLNILNMRFVQCSKEVKTIAVCAGSGGSNLKHIFLNYKNIDTFITADIKYDVMLTSYNMNINIIDAGHYETEKFVVNYFKEIINKHFNEIEIIILQKNYIMYT